MQKQRTLSIRIDKERFNFIKQLSKEQKEEISKSVRELVDLGRLMLAIEKYGNGQISLGKAAELANVSIGEMMSLLEKFNIKSNLEYEDYLQGLENLRKAW